MEVLSILRNNQILIIIGLVIVIIAKTFKFLNNWLDYKKEELALKKYDIDIHLNVTEDIEQRLDNIIESAFQEYTLMNTIYKSDWYIKEEEEIKINKDICALVADRISPIMMQHLMVYYNEEAVFDVISKRVYFKVTNFVIEHNKAKPL
jgi:predicted Holliday junction resolvase-like endonuclease